IEVAKWQAFVLRTDHLIYLVIMGEEFGAIDASSFCFGSLQATLPEAPEEFNVSCMHGDHALMVRETSIRDHLSRIRTILLLKKNSMSLACMAITLSWFVKPPSATT